MIVLKNDKLRLGKRILSFVVLIVCIAQVVLGQTGETNDSGDRPRSERSQTFYVEAFGPGLTSANYDFRFVKNNPAGWGGRVGVGYFAVDGFSYFSIPLQVNYLLGGKNGNYFEVGGGTTYSSGRFAWEDNDETGHAVSGSLAFGYRKQPIDGGFNFRAGISPMFGSGYFIPYWPYLSLGYTF